MPLWGWHFIFIRNYDIKLPHYYQILRPKLRQWIWNFAVKEDLDVAPVQYNKTLQIGKPFESWSEEKAEEDLKSLVWWEGKSPFKKNETGVGAKKGNPIRRLWGVFHVVRLGPCMNTIFSDKRKDSSFFLSREIQSYHRSYYGLNSYHR